jgi:hypothetical protein
VTRDGILRGRPEAADTEADTLDLSRASRERVASNDRTLTDTWPGGIWPTSDTWLPAPRRWVRVSATATFGLIISLIALCATLTGLLAPEGLALGVTGLLASIGGLVAASKPWITGHSLAILGLAAGLAAIALALAAITGHLSWLHSHTDEISRWHGWLVAHWSRIGGW